MKIKNESFSDLLNKYILITIELSRLSALMVYFNDCGDKPRFAATIDTIKRLDTNKLAISIELDKRMPNTNDAKPNEDTTGTSS
jgi:hypothetical protein